MAAQQSGTTGPSPAPAGGGRDWPTEVTDRVESLVSAVRDKTTVPITKVARAIVFGLVVLTAAVAALVLAVIAVLRVLDVYLPFGPLGRRVWVADLAVGAIFLLGGAFCWSKRSPRSQESS